MEWIIFGFYIIGFVFLLMLGLPVAFSFLTINMIAVFFLWNGVSGLEVMTINLFESISLFSLLPIPMFILMGELMFRTGIGFNVINALGNWMGAIPGRLSLLSVGSGTLFSVLSGSSVASTSLLGSLLVPEMKKNGYKNEMSIGPILGSAGLATMLPPTALGVILASLAGIPVGEFLIAIIIPGLILASIFILYIIIRCRLNPDLAPKYDVNIVSTRKKIKDTIMYIFPLGLIVGAVVIIIVFGIATPTESAVIGALGVIILTVIYRKISLQLFVDSFRGTLRITSMILMIMANAAIFSQVLSFTGITDGIISLIDNLDIPTIILILLIQFLLIILGLFLEPVSIMMMTLPLLVPIAQGAGLDITWFGVILLITIQMATITPPFGMDLFAMKGVTTNDIKMGDIYRSALPFVILMILCMILIILIPSLALWLPSLMN
ncbi:TRAP transporter large permease subunit [Salicibibacter cibarius]|uniref:TRAP transporter large permease subunit n=1 Tax=Salicibibacter cibarius TaxID=2743000 RepID=A0A7T7CA24_9BACI|nr:TRAP transporter large permease subunit [Salicibibacter cibarius]QQK74405.1 TRAP transporter large permease subunit [Salicibibacter cibarius]